MAAACNQLMLTQSICSEFFFSTSFILGFFFEISMCVKPSLFDWLLSNRPAEKPCSISGCSRQSVYPDVVRIQMYQQGGFLLHPP